MSGTSSSPRSIGRVVDLTTALAVCALLLVMVIMPTLLRKNPTKTGTIIRINFTPRNTAVACFW